MSHFAKKDPEQVRIGGMVPKEDEKALRSNAKVNGRSLAAELRLAVTHWLKSQGRRA